uniref:Uncharacterized protein n=3 Tax=Leptocylindrus danicus TaxID=163516 RepID=A0A7S2JUG5_9STRA|mmetsp:Transcript_1180/g.1698  ORF Transcript_1180/g.1698 Transcript_1180/m.1698 type:complete len:399 (+) Transcript_1180:81-1277(+)
MEISAALLIMGFYTDAGQYFGRTWSLWLAAISFLASPFWFNPLTFDWKTVTSDYSLYTKWIRGTTGGAGKSWSVWWSEENSYYSKLPVSSKLLFIIKTLVYYCIADGIRRSDLFDVDTSLSKPFVSVSKVAIFLVVLFILSRIFVATERDMSYPIRRSLGAILSLGMAVSVVTVFIEDPNCIRYSLAAYYYIGSIALLGLLFGFKFVKHVYLVHDLVVGHILFLPLFVLAALQIPNYIQTWLLYHNALSGDVVVDDILRYAKKSMKSDGSGDDDLKEQVAELKKLVQRQEEMLRSGGGFQRTNSFQSFGSSSRNESTDAIATLISQDGREPIKPSLSNTKRVMSMSGMDVWGDMALGNESGGESTVITHPSPTVSQVPTSSANVSDFSFSQPDTMPPR